MSLFGDVGDFFSSIPNTLLKVATNPTTFATTVLTGGLNLVSKDVSSFVSPIVGKLYDPKLIPLAIGAATHVPLLSGGYSVGPQPFLGSLVPPSRPQPLPYQGVQPMGLNLGNILNTIGGVFGSSTLPYAQDIAGLANVAGQFLPAPAANLPSYPVNAPAAQPVSAMMPMIRGAGRMLTKEVFDAGAKLLSRLGIPFSASTGSFSSALKRSISSIASLARRTPAGTIVSILLGLGLTAYESNLLVAWHAQRKRGRRMNPANSKALRRAARRIKSFHKLCIHTDVLKAGRRGGTYRQSRCGTCRKSPCRC